MKKIKNETSWNNKNEEKSEKRKGNKREKIELISDLTDNKINEKYSKFIENILNGELMVFLNDFIKKSYVCFYINLKRQNN